MNNDSLAFIVTTTIIVISLLSLSWLLSTSKASSSSSTNDHSYYYQKGPIADPNDNPMHIKAQQQAAENACDKGHGNPLCFNATIQVLQKLILRTPIIIMGLANSCYNIGYRQGIADSNDDAVGANGDGCDSSLHSQRNQRLPHTI
jgi:hypothetical protein